MSVIRATHNKYNPYVQLNKKTLENSSLSLEARGLFVYLMNLPDDWNINVKHLAKKFKIGEEKVRRILKELKSENLCHYVRQRCTFENGKPKWGKGDYLIFETQEEFKKMFSGGFQDAEFADAEFADAEFADAEFADAENSDLYVRFKELKKKEQRKDVASAPPAVASAPRVASAPSHPSFSKEAKKLCENLADKILSHKVKFKDPRLNTTLWNKWLREMERFIQVDKFSDQEILSLVEFAHEDDFWCQHILSPKKLRKHAEKLLFQIAKKNKRPTKERREELNREEAKRVVEILDKKHIPKNIVIECLGSYIELGNTNHPNKKCIEYSEYEFKYKLENRLMQMGILKHLTKKDLTFIYS